MDTVTERIDRALNKQIVLTESLHEITSNIKTPYAIIGGHAVTIHGHPRTTQDIDLLTLDANAVAQELNGTNPQPMAIGGITVNVNGVEVDIIQPEQPWAADAIEQAVDTQYGRVVSKPYLVLTKLWASRGEQDDTDIIYTLRTMNEEEIALTKNLIAVYFPAYVDDVDSMIEIAKHVTNL
ncbi:MAG: hypothetical protein JRI80_18255 [Deltaproteobacteria bacterium]|nr:hypothetical protein [Deltaproteobacteria bacterium]